MKEWHWRALNHVKSHCSTSLLPDWLNLVGAIGLAQIMEATFCRESDENWDRWMDIRKGKLV